MKGIARKFALCALVLAAPLFAACTSEDASGHSVNLGGVNHRDGSVDPLTNCVGCHGSNLHGGKGPSCYSCHNSNDHQTVRAGVRHNQPGVDCTRCHGVTRTRGGIGPACVGSGCHSA
jgi:hypothetical protein